MTAPSIAITGIGCRLPGANTVDEFWELIRSGRHTFEPTGVTDNGDSAFVPIASRLDEFDMFEPEFFGITAHDALVMDPQQRTLLEAAWSALEDADYASSTNALKIGVFASVSNSTYLSGPLTQSGRWDESDPSYPIMIGNDKDFAASRISFAFGLTGPAYSVQSACSSSLTAAHAACQSLADGLCDVAVVAASSISLPFLDGYRAKTGSIFSPSGCCRPFSDASDGTVKGNGAVAVVLRPADAAATANNRAYADISGWGINNDGARKTGIAAPSVIGQREAIQAAVSASGIASDAVRYFETHGTGTQIGDPIELRALIDGYQLIEQPTQKRPYIGSLKSTMGHLDAAAGIAGLAKAALVLHHQRVPPLAGFTGPSPLVMFATKKVALPTEEVEPQHPLEAAAVTSLGMGGTNVHAILSRASSPSAPQTDTGEPRIVTLSARTEASLHKYVGALTGWIERHPEASLGQIADTLALRKEFDVRVRAEARTPQELATNLLAAHPETTDRPRTPDDISEVTQLRNTPVSLPPYQWSRKRYYVDVEPQHAENTSTVTKTSASAVTLDDLQSTTLRIMQEVLNDDAFALDDNFFDGGGDSLSAIDLIDALKADHSGALLTFDDVQRYSTAAELSALIHQRLTASLGPNRNEGIAVPLSPALRRNRLFLTHPAGGSVSMYRDLARHLSDAWEVTGLNFPRAQLTKPSSLIELAAEYAEAIRSIQPTGPYFLGGYSLGGNLSIEIAKLLEADGQQVPAIIMYDSYATSDYISGSTDASKQTLAEEALMRLLPRHMTAPTPPPNADAGPREIDVFLQIWKHNQRALASWVPDMTRVSSRLLVFKATVPFPSDLADAVGFRPTGPESWQEFTTADVAVEYVEASHYTLFDDPKLIESMAHSTARFLGTHVGDALLAAPQNA